MNECIVPNCHEEVWFYTGYLFREDGSEELCGSMWAKIKWGWCKKHIDDATYTKFVNPIFENEKALALFKRTHPILWKRQKHKEPLFIKEAKQTQ